MLAALLVATLCSLVTACGVLMVQGLAGVRRDRRVGEQRKLASLARKHGPLTPITAATHLGVTILAAERLLRGMVDDVYFTMVVDDEQGVLRYGFTERGLEEVN